MVARISALVITITIVAVVIAFMLWRIGTVMGWDQARSAWPVIAALTVIVLLVGWFIYIAVRNKINR
jgi:hypothetical protein